MRKVDSYLTVVSLLVILLLAVIAAPSFFDPVFQCRNSARESASVEVFWRDQRMLVGELRPGESTEFTLDAEAAIVFKVHFAAGRKLESRPLYFSDGTRITAVILDDEIKLEYDSSHR